MCYSSLFICYERYEKYLHDFWYRINHYFFVAIMTYDFSFDGQWYHMDAIKLMSNGWNFYYESEQVLMIVYGLHAMQRQPGSGELYFIVLRVIYRLLSHIICFLWWQIFFDISVNKK